MFPIFDGPGSGSAVLGPVEVGRFGSDIGGCDVRNFGAVGDLVEGDIVHIGVPGRRGTHGTDGDIGTISSEIVEFGGELGPTGAAARIDIVCCCQLEGADIGGVGHHTDIKHGMVGGA